MPAPEGSQGLDDGAAPSLHRVGNGNMAEAQHGSTLPTAMHWVGEIEQAAQRAASHLAFDRTYYESAALPGLNTSVRQQGDAQAAPGVNFWTSGSTPAPVVPAAPFTADGAWITDDVAGNRRVDAPLVDLHEPWAGQRLPSSRTGDDGRDVMATQRGGVGTLALHTPQSTLQGVTQKDLGTDAVVGRKPTHTFDAAEKQPHNGAALPWSWDGRGQYDSTVKGGAVGISTGPDIGGTPLLKASDRPGSIGSETVMRVSNDRMLFGTGQSMLQTPNVLVLPSQMDRSFDASASPDVHLGHTSLLRDAFLGAHPSTYGKAAEFRNTYHTKTRAGIVIENQETKRAEGHPHRRAVDNALAQQAARVTAIRHRENVEGAMNAVRVAYESDAYASDA